MIRFIKYTSILILIAGIFTIVSAASLYYILAPKLPAAEILKDTQLQVPLRIFSAEGLLLAEFGEKRRIPLDYNEIPKPLIQAILASEDDRFFEHPGVDYHGILRAVYSLITTGQKAQGGSTITMQVARNFFLSSEKTYLRKLNEIILALQIEQVLTKEEILTLYLNKIYLGNRSYGVGAAANVYYGKSLQDLTLPEFAMIAGLPKAPSKYNPMANPERALLRRNYVLRRMWEVDYITEQDYLIAIQAPSTAQRHSRNIEGYAPFVAEMVRNQLVEQYGEEAYNTGLNVYTTIRTGHQQAANTALQSALLSYDKRHGYRGARAQIGLIDDVDNSQLLLALSKLETVGPLQPAIVKDLTAEVATVHIKDIGATELTLDSIKWARPQLSTNSRGKEPSKVSDVLHTGDVIYVTQDEEEQWQLAQLPEVEGALIAVSPFDGAVTALNGGFDYFHNKFNRVTQSRRQPGSGFKPFLYSAALEKGYTAASIINDAPVVLEDAGLEDAWRPENYSRKFFGPTRLRVALAHSRNLVSIRLLRDITSDYAIKYISRFGFDADQMPRNLSLALGSGQASPWTMARAYSVIANGGYRIEPYIIQRIEDASGNIIMQAQPDTVCETCIAGRTVEQAGFSPAKRVITAQNSYLMNSLLRGVVTSGTGRKALSLGRTDLAGKTGTTNDQIDAWFNGFHPELVAISWIGFDSPQTLGRYETGGRAALPMWIDFMKIALKGVPAEPLVQPVGMVTVQIDPETGLLARPETENAIAESFRDQYPPTQLAPELDPNPIDGDDPSSPDIDLF